MVYSLMAVNCSACFIIKPLFLIGSLIIKDAEIIRTLREEKGIKAKDNQFTMTLCGVGRPEFR